MGFPIHAFALARRGGPPSEYAGIHSPKKIDLVINIPKNFTRRELRNGYNISRNAIDFNIPLITNSRVASAFVFAICKYTPETLSIKSWEEYS
jgi:carbamoyl-phosphate synthase large subunit